MPSFSANDWILPAAVGLGILGFALFRRRAALSPADIQALKERGALVLDVRTPEEFRQAHAPGSLNIPLGSLDQSLARLDRNRPILTVCASGLRSGLARKRLLRAGFQEVHNAGRWQAVLEA